MSYLFTIVIQDLSLLVDFAAFEDANVVGWCNTSKLLGGAFNKCSTAEDVALFVNDLTFLIDGECVWIDLASFDLLQELLIFDLGEDVALFIDYLTDFVELLAL